MKIKVVNQRLYLEPPETAEGTREYLRAEFSFSEEWDGMTKTAFFRGADGDTYTQLLENDACTVPAAALAAPGRVGVSVSGTLGETVITTDIKSFSVPATLSGGTPSDPEPTLWQEVLDKFEKVSEVEEKVTELDKKCDTIPTRVSQLENNSGFLTEHQDISGKLDTEKLPEAIDTALAQAKKSGVFDGKDGANGKDGTPGEQGPKGEPGETTYIENPYDDTELKSEIATKITVPENPEVGKVFKIKSVNDDGTFIGEWADCANLDVRINGESIVRDGVAEIPLCTNSNTPGLVTIDAYPTSGGLYRANVKTGLVRINKATDDMISKRSNGYCPIVPLTLDYAVKSAMCDGKGVAWTADEQTMARERMDAEQGSYRLIADMVLEEDIKSIVIDKDLNGEPLSLKTARVIVQHPVPRESGKNNGYVIINKTKGVYGAVDWKRDNQATYAMVDVYVYGENTPAFITFSSAVPILVAQTRYMLTSRGNVVQYFEKINAITVMSNYYFDAGTRITILGKE